MKEKIAICPCGCGMRFSGQSQEFIDKALGRKNIIESKSFIKLLTTVLTPPKRKWFNLK